MLKISGKNPELVDSQGEVLDCLSNLLEGEFHLHSVLTSSESCSSLEDMAEPSFQLLPSHGSSLVDEQMFYYNNSIETHPTAEFFGTANGVILAPDESRTTAEYMQTGTAHSVAEPVLEVVEVPDWCKNLSFSDLDDLSTELNKLKSQVTAMERKLERGAQLVSDFDEVKNGLLSSNLPLLRESCFRAFELLGWSVSISDTCPNELWLLDGNKILAIVYVTSASAHPNRSELSKLAQLIVDCWVKFDTEPKGIFLANTFAEQLPQERTTENFPGQLSDFANRKNICLLTSLQLLTMYKDAQLNKNCKAEIRDKVLSTTGKINTPQLDFQLRS
jgi:hypothetical protein